MNKRLLSSISAGAALMCTALATASGAPSPGAYLSIDPAKLPRVGTVDERYQSYNVEMLEVTGGKFWRPYGPELEAALKQPAPSATPSESGDTPTGMNPALYQYRPPIDLTNKRLRKLAAALGPRVRACERDLGKFDVSRGVRQGAGESACRLRWSLDPPAMERRDRLLAGSRCRHRHLLRHLGGDAQRGRRLEY